MDSKSSSKSAGDLFVRTMRKQSLRAKERVLEKLGKSEKTQDELFDEYVNNITKQQNNALRLQKEVKNYVACVKAMAVASKSLHDVIAELYEAEWTDCGQIKSGAEQLQLLRFDRTKNIGEDILNDIQNYLNQFPEAKAKVAKRNRKLVDFDGARYSLSAVVNAPKKNELKIAKAQDELTTMQKLYENLNDELHRELPSLYDSRVGFYGHTLKMIWETEANYHTQSGLCFNNLSEASEKLSEQGKASYRYIPPAPSATLTTGKRPIISGPISQDSVTSPVSEGTKDIDIRKNGNGTGLDVRFQAKSKNLSDQNGDNAGSSNSEKGSSLETGYSVSPAPASVERTSSVRMYPELPSELPSVEEKTTEIRLIRHNRLASLPSSDDDDTFCDVPEATSPDLQLVNPSAPVKNNIQEGETQVRDLTADLKKLETSMDAEKKLGVNIRIERKVKATNPYVAEDGDEISFEKGEIISVVPYENPDEQDEGWLMGIKESDGKKGVFPENFTKPLTP